MSYCNMQCDYPLRVQFGPGLVVHAAHMRKTGGYLTRRVDPLTGQYGESYRTPVVEEISIACRRWYRRDKHKVEDKHVIDNTTTITCKACAKAMGMSETRVAPIRYVIYKRSTNEFYKKSGWCAQPWVEDVGDATLYKVKGVAEQKTMRVFYERIDGERIKYDEYCRLRKEGEQVVRGHEKNPDLSVKIVKLVVE